MCKSAARQKFYVIGLSDERDCWFQPSVLRLINESRVFSGGLRHHEIVAHLLPQGSKWIDITVPLDNVFSQYEGESQVVVFASGDPLFYGFASTIIRRLPCAEVEVFPSFNSLMLLAHKALIPYHNMVTLSLTGRPWTDIDAALIRGEALIGSLTDRHKTPAALAGRMLEYGYDNYRMTVGEMLGNRESERIRTFSLEEAAVAEFEFPNCLILQRTEARPHPFGLPENEFHLLDGRVNMITKRPVRLLTLSQLDLPRHKSFWDVGFCTGSVSIEARLQFPHLSINSFEIRPEGEELMSLNSRKFGAPGIEVHIGDFLRENLEQIEAPDAVFIGGHGGHLEEIVAAIDRVLLPGGVIVFNSVSLDSRKLFEKAVSSVGRSIVEVVHVAIDSFNPIDIMKAQ